MHGMPTQSTLQLSYTSVGTEYWHILTLIDRLRTGTRWLLRMHGCLYISIEAVSVKVKFQTRLEPRGRDL